MTKASKIPTLPVAANRIDSRLQAALSVKRKIGMFIALAESEECFTRFEAEVERVGALVLSEPIRLLTAPHLYNAIALKLANCSSSSKPLIEGQVQDLLTRGMVGRLTTLSRNDKPYNVFGLPEAIALVRRAVAAVRKALDAAGEVTSATAAGLIAPELATTPMNVELILGHIVRLGLATTARPLGKPLVRIQVPL